LIVSRDPFLILSLLARGAIFVGEYGVHRCMCVCIYIHIYTHLHARIYICMSVRPRLFSACPRRSFRLSLRGRISRRCCVVPEWSTRRRPLSNGASIDAVHNHLLSCILAIYHCPANTKSVGFNLTTTCTALQLSYPIISAPIGVAHASLSLSPARLQRQLGWTNAN
jgi:hypothetical protein